MLDWIICLGLTPGEQGGSLDDNFPYSYLFRFIMIDEQLEDISYFLTIGIIPKGYTIAQKKKLVVKAIAYQLIVGQFYNLGVNDILRRCILKHEREEVMKDAHEGTTEGHYVGKLTTHKIMQVVLWWPTIFRDTKDYCDNYDVCQRVGKTSRRDEMPLNMKITLQPFDKWDIDFIRPINPLARRSDVTYIITTIDYLTRWAKATVVKD